MLTVVESPPLATLPAVVDNAGIDDISVQRNDGSSLTRQIAAVVSELAQIRRLFENRINETPFLDIEAAASFVRITPASLIYYAKRARLVAYHVVGKTLVFHRDDLIAFMKRNRRPGVDG